MNIKALPLLLLTILTGCATTAIDPNIPKNVKLTAPDSYGNHFIDTVTFKLNPEQSKGNLTKCVVLNVTNEEHTLSDSSNSFIGGYSGSIHSIEKNQNVGGGQSILYSDKSMVVAKGNVDGTYSSGIVPITQIISYKVSVDTSPDKNEIIFSNVRFAQKSTGYVNNDGFNKVGSWPGAKPVFAYELLKQVSDNIQTCLSK